MSHSFESDGTDGSFALRPDVKSTNSSQDHHHFFIVTLFYFLLDRLDSLTILENSKVCWEILIRVDSENSGYGE